MVNKIYFKSLINADNMYQTMTFNPKQNHGITCQVVNDILKYKTLKPNTDHNELNKRLCVSLITTEYNKTYRPEGLVFTTDEEPEYCIPFDLMALTNGKTFTSCDYSSKFLEGHRIFLFKTINEMISKYQNPEKAIEGLNSFRKMFLLEPL